jgi:hypothetical protein
MTLKVIIIFGVASGCSNINHTLPEALIELHQFSQK